VDTRPFVHGSVVLVKPGNEVPNCLKLVLAATKYSTMPMACQSCPTYIICLHYSEILVHIVKY